MAQTTAPAALTLVSHALCPYVQRVAIVLHEKGLAFERRTIDLARKPDWFLALSPLGKTPVLQVRGQSLFESAVICEYLDEVAMPVLHPQDPLQRARHRAWMEFGSAVLNTIGAFYAAQDEATLQARAQDLRSRFVQIEEALGQRSSDGGLAGAGDAHHHDEGFSSHVGHPDTNRQIITRPMIILTRPLRSDRERG